MELSKSYAGALYSLAAENGVQDERKTALDAVAHPLRENPAYTQLIAAPTIPMDEQRTALRGLLSSRLGERFYSSILAREKKK